MNDLLKNVTFASIGKRLFGRGLVAAVCVACLLPFAAAAQSAKPQLMRGLVPAVTSQLRPIETLTNSRQMKLAIVLPLRNQEALSNLLAELYNQNSTNFHRFLTPEQFTAMFGPTEQDYQAIIDYATANGLTITGTHPNRTLLDVEASVADIRRVFHVNMRVYRHPKENRTFYAPDVEPSIDAPVPVLTIIGFNNYVLPRPLFHKPADKLSSTNKALVSTTGSGPSGSFMGYDFRKAYVPNTSLVGAGQTVALFECAGFFPGDITAYVAQAGLPGVPPLQVVPIDGGAVAPFPGDGVNLEVALDIEMAICMAPGLSKIIVYEGPTDSPTVDGDILNRIANDNLAKQISSSWLIDDSSQYAQIYTQFAMQGQTFLQASGDECAYYPGIFQFEDSPLVTLVGGTTLTTAGPGGAWATETVWNWGNEFGPQEDGVGSGGGISGPAFGNYPIPSWQQGINMTNNQGSTTMRNIPDVALTADNIFVVADDGEQEPGIGGTSAAAPLWAGLMALANQQAASLGNTPPGFINPIVYTVGKGANYASDFHDTTTGNNFSANSPALFKAVTGYDLCTGWGTPKGQSLINALAGTPQPLGLLQASVNPPSGAALIASSSQPIFVTVNDVIGMTNATVTATITGAVNQNLTFLNGGVSPDTTANDNIYSATFLIPNVQGSVAMTVVATNTGEVSITNTFYYSVISPPLNDNFASATKVPAVGAVYLSNNRFATLESGEPAHDGLATARASLWWSYTPANNTNVLVDTTGSANNVIIAVYTGTTLLNLVPVASTNQTFVNFNASGGTTYSIAIASPNTNSTGSIHLRIAPGGHPDITSPTVLVASPLSGLWVSNKLVYLSGTANDPAPDASGLNGVSVSVNSQYSFVADGTTNWLCPVILKSGLNNLQAIAYDNAGKASTPANLQITYFAPNPNNDLFANAIPLLLTNNAGSVSVINTNATKEFDEPNHGGNPGGKSVWWSFLPQSDGILTLNCTNSTFDTLLGLYTGTDVASLTAIAENDDAYSGVPGGFSFIAQAVRAGQTYHIAVDGYNGASGIVNLSYTFTTTTVFHLTTSATNGGSVQVTSTNALGGTAIMPGTAGDFPGGSEISLTAIPNSGFQFNTWSGANSSTNNPLSLEINSDLNITGQFGPFGFTDGFESGNLSQLNWTTAGSAPWFVQSSVVESGRYAVRSGIIGNSQTSSLILATNNFLTGPASFDFRVSSETNFDLLSFYMDGVLLGQWSGEVGWATFGFQMTAGAHVLEWRYSKDASLSSGLDAAFMDNANLPIDPPALVLPSPASLHLQHLGNGTYAVNLLGQTNQQYILQVSPDLITWQNISTNTAVGGFVQIPDPASVSNATRFYRAVTAP